MSQHFSSYRFQDANGDIPVDWFRMPKSSHEPGLEIADLIVHTSGCQVRDRLGGRIGWRKDFECIFRQVDDRLVSYIEIGSVRIA